MLAVNLPLRTRGGQVERLTGEGRAGQFGLPRVASELYASAQRFRVFTSERPSRGLDGILDVIAMPADEVRKRVAEERALVRR